MQTSLPPRGSQEDLERILAMAQTVMLTLEAMRPDGTAQFDQLALGCALIAFNQEMRAKTGGDPAQVEEGIRLMREAIQRWGLVQIDTGSVN